MDIQHPVITQMERTGYPYSERREEVGVDPLGNMVYDGDEILVIDDEFYLVEELSIDAIEILERHGAVYMTAK